MALVRCPIHKIPYNDENPRGCPACAREKEGGDQSRVMQELAKATRSSQRVQSPAAPQPRAPEKELAPGELWRQSLAQAKAPIVIEPPEVEDELGSGPLGWLGDRRRKLTIGWITIGVLAILVWISSGPGYVDAPSPPELTVEPRPLTVEPFAPITTVFSVLGPQPPEAVPDAPQLARHSYGSGLTIDALNRRVYAITLEVGSRSWNGLRVGMSERAVEGTLALLGSVQRGQPATRSLEEVGGYSVYPSLDDRPRRTLLVEVRPPNGCYDVTVDLQPQATGILRSGGRRYAVVGQGSNPPLTWVATRIRITTRRVSGPYAGVAC
jgi:hypothetical protein